MADAGKVMFLGLRVQAIERELQKAKVMVEAFKVVENHWDEFDQSLADDFEDLARNYDCEVEKLQASFKEAEAEWLQAGEEYRAEHRK